MHYHELKPRELVIERTRRPVAYLPLGNLEWHGHHNPVGLDGIKAEAVLAHIASQLGGLVMPTIYWGDNRADIVEVIYDPAVSSFPPSDAYDHATMICQEMKLSRSQLEADGARSTANGGWRMWEELLVHTFFQIQTLGFKLIIPYPGHYPMHWPLDRAVAAYQARGGSARVFVLKDHLVARGDHAARFETSLLLRLRPELVDLSQLSPVDVVHLGVLGEDPLKYATAGYGQEVLAQFLQIVCDQFMHSNIER